MSFAFITASRRCGIDEVLTRIYQVPFRLHALPQNCHFLDVIYSNSLLQVEMLMTEELSCTDRYLYGGANADGGFQFACNTEWRFNNDPDTELARGLRDNYRPIGSYSTEGFRNQYPAIREAASVRDR